MICLLVSLSTSYLQAKLNYWCCLLSAIVQYGGHDTIVTGYNSGHTPSPLLAFGHAHIDSTKRCFMIKYLVIRQLKGLTSRVSYVSLSWKKQKQKKGDSSRHTMSCESHCNKIHANVVISSIYILKLPVNIISIYITWWCINGIHELFLSSNVNKYDKNKPLKIQCKLLVRRYGSYFLFWLTSTSFDLIQSSYQYLKVRNFPEYTHPPICRFTKIVNLIMLKF